MTVVGFDGLPKNKKVAFYMGKWTGTIKMWIFSRYTRRYPFQETVDLMGEFECRSEVNKFHVLFC